MFSKLERENSEAHKNLSGTAHEENSDKAEVSQESTTVEATEQASTSENKSLPVEQKVGFFQSIINWFKGLFGKKS